MTAKPAQRAEVPYGGIPPTLVYQAEDGHILGSCDWGRCDGEQVGWAVCGQHDEPGDDEWLAICAKCLERGHSKSEPEHVVSESFTFAQVEQALGWPEGSIQ